jgi:hypothetical protein
MAIIEALERRDPDAAARLAREHTLGLAAHVERHGGFLDAVKGNPAEAGVHPSDSQSAEKWVPAFAGMEEEKEKPGER